MLEISLLGPVAVRRDGESVAVPGGKTAELLVRLALDAGTTVSADRLVDDLWAGASTRRNTLQAKVARLRRALPAEIQGTYRLAVRRDEVDALCVLRDVATAAQRLDAGDEHGARELSTAALDRFRGELLPAAPGDWAAPHRSQLEEARAKLLETQLTARIRLGEAVVAETEAAVARDPYREGLWELLITALYRAGRQADALAAYQRVRARLADDLALEPGPRLKELERQVLQQDAALHAAPAGNLPSLRAELVGREAEVAAVTGLLAAHRLVEVVGPGGVGKTVLAIATGRARPTTVWLARLEAATTAGDVIDTVIAALEVTGGEAALFERLRAPSVLILDNCEHVLDAAAALAVRLLDAAPALKILATSQVALGIDGEALHELAPLALDDAVELFTRRATRPGDDPTELCRALDGLPLAIELAAARTKTLSIEEISRRIDDRFSVLRDPTSRKPERRRALKATIGWSYDLLFPDDQRGLWALATFSGGAPLTAVESVMEALDVPASAAIDVVGRLAARSLVIVDGDRYGLLESIRAFALEAMGEETPRGFDAHAAWFAAAAAESTAGVRSARQTDYLRFARTERANIDAALAWSDPLQIVDMNVVTSISRRNARVEVTYATRRSIAMKPSTLPSSEASPPDGAFSSTSATPPNAITAKTSARGSMYSANSHAPKGTIRNGASDPISAALATLLCVAPAKNTARLRPKNTPGSQTWRTFARVTLRPVLQRTAFHKTLTAIIRQNATSTPA